VHPVAVLFVRADSIYKTLEGVDCYDAERNALTWQGGCPVVAHPPCRLWSSMAHFSSAPPEEKALGPWAIKQVRQWGGVLEHPASSKLFKHCDCPRPGKRRDAYGGWTFAVDQHWWGHRAQKKTLLYICGCEPLNIPAWPLVLSEAGYGMHGPTTNQPCRKPEIKHWEREATPPAFALWLVELARRCEKHNAAMRLEEGAKADDE